MPTVAVIVATWCALVFLFLWRWTVAKSDERWIEKQEALAKAGEAILELGDVKKENIRLEDVAERRREAVERIAAELDKAFDDLKECRKQLLDALERHRSAVEGRNKRDERLCLAAEVLNDAVREFGSKRITN